MLVDRVLQFWRSIRNTTTYRNPGPWLADWFNTAGGMSDTGEPVSPNNAMHLGPYFAGVSLIASAVGTLPLPVYKRTKDGRERDRTHPAYRCLNYEANSQMTADTVRSVLQCHALNYGNGRAAILRTYAPETIELIPLLPERTETFLYEGSIWHKVRLLDGEERNYMDQDVLHIKNLGHDGITGWSVARMAPNTLGLSIAAEKHGARLFKNMAIPPIVLECDGRVTKQDALQLLADWNTYHSGENSGRTGLLHSGVKAHVLGLPNKDSEWLDLRKYQRSEIAALLAMPPHLLGDDSRISYNSLEQEEKAWLFRTLKPWFVRWQLECRRKLLREREKETDSHYIEFFVDDLISVDFSQKIEALTKLVAATIISPNEAREKLNMNHREDGDVFVNPHTTSHIAADEPRPRNRLVDSLLLGNGNGNGNGH